LVLCFRKKSFRRSFFKVVQSRIFRHREIHKYKDSSWPARN
jgi:hypothetical protein